LQRPHERCANRPAADDEEIELLPVYNPILDVAN